MSKKNTNSNGERSADKKYDAFAKDNKEWHTKVEKSIEKVHRSARRSSGRASA